MGVYPQGQGQRENPLFLFWSCPLFWKTTLKAKCYTLKTGEISNISDKAVLSYLLPLQEFSIVVKHDDSRLRCIGCKILTILCWYLWSWWWPRTVTLCGKFLQRKREGDDKFGVGDKTSWKHPAAQIWVISGHIWGWGQNILKTTCPDMGHLRPSLRRKLANMRIFCSIGIINGRTKSQN